MFCSNLILDKDLTWMYKPLTAFLIKTFQVQVLYKLIRFDISQELWYVGFYVDIVQEISLWLLILASFGIISTLINSLEDYPIMLWFTRFEFLGKFT